MPFQKTLSGGISCLLPVTGWKKERSFSCCFNTQLVVELSESRLLQTLSGLNFVLATIENNGWIRESQDCSDLDKFLLAHFSWQCHDMFRCSDHSDRLKCLLRWKLAESSAGGLGILYRFHPPCGYSTVYNGPIQQGGTTGFTNPAASWILRGPSAMSNCQKQIKRQVK